jgi:hypothetical protein
MPATGADANPAVVPDFDEMTNEALKIFDDISTIELMKNWHPGNPSLLPPRFIKVHWTAFRLSAYRRHRMA